MLGSPGGPARLRLRTACSLMRDPMSRYWIRKQGSRVKNRAPSAAGSTMARMSAAEPTGRQDRCAPRGSPKAACRAAPPLLPHTAAAAGVVDLPCPALQPQLQCMCCRATRASFSLGKQRTCHRASCILVACSGATCWPAVAILARAGVQHGSLLAGAVLHRRNLMCLLLA